MLALQDDREARIDALRALGALYEGPLRDARQALRTWELLLVDDPDAEGPRLSLARAALDSGASSAAEEHYGRLAVVATTPAVRAESALRMGLLRRDAGDFAAAERHLGAALEAGQDPRSVLQALEDVLARLGRHADQARILEQRIQVGDPEEARDALRRLAHLYEGPLDDPARAASAIARLALADSGNVEPLLWLARVSEAAGDSSGRVDALHRAAALTTEGPRAAEILTDAAIAVGSDPGRRDRVIALLDEALDRDPACLRAARLLDTRLEEIGAHEARSRLLARVAEAAQDPDARADARLALAQVRLVALGDPRGALQDALAAATQRPAESATLAARIASEIDDPAVEAAALAALLEARRDAPAATLRDSRMRLATLLSGSLGVPARAIEELRAVLSAAPGDTEATTALTALLRAGDDPEALADHLLGAPDDAPDLAAVIEEAARALGRAAAGDADRAIGLLERSWSLAQDEAVAETLDALYSSTGRLGPRQQLLERRADRQPPGVQRELLGRLAGLLPEAEAGGLDARLAALGDSAAVDRQVERLRAAGDTGAVVTLLAQVAMSAPAGPGRVRALLAAADAADEAADVEALEDALREAVLEDPSAAEPTDRLVTLRIARNDLAGATVVLAQAEGFTAEPTRKASLMFRRAELHTRAGDDDAAIDALSRALACDPEDPEVQASLEGAYRRAGRWPELVALLAARAEELPVGDARAELSMEVSLLLEERLRDLAGAARLALRAADAFGHPDARAAAASRAVDLSHAAGEPTLEAEALQRLAGVTTDDGRAADALVARATRLREAGDATGAEAALEAALGRRPDHARALLELGMARQAQGAIDQARSLLQRFVDAGGGTAPERHEAVRVIAHCARAQGDLDGARSALERWAQLSPEDPAPHAARAALELEGGDGPAALVAMDALVDRSQDPAARFHALLDRGRLWRDRLGEPGHAARDFLAAAVIEPSAPPDSSQPRRDREVAETALALAVEAESWQDAVRSASVLLERTQEPLRLRELHEVRARLRAQRLGDYAGAVEDLVAATRADAGPAADDLLAALVDAGLTAGRVDAAFEGLDALVSRPRSSVDRATLCVRVAQAAEQVGHLDRAKAAYRRALELGARAPGAIATQLVRLLDPQRERDELRSLLELQLATQNLEARDPEARAAVLRRLATLSLDANEDTSAERHLRALADIAPADPLAFEHLRRIYEHRGAWPALLELLRARVRLPAGPSELVGMLHDIGRLLQDKLGTEGEAADAYREVLRLDPNYVSTLDALADLCFRRADFVEADALYARLGERGSLPLDTLLVRRAECAERMGRATEAVVHYRSALASNPRNGRASEAFARLLALAGQLEEASSAARSSSAHPARRSAPPS